ncbi:TetR family transcriptional regulator [Arsenophonus endosymbiont of Bemisia tabaci Asia II 3]|nr:TetR family transcriptional regulator [Arsenophonus endosymbiont of Bemisia tabaci Asia II 3]
MGRQRSIDRDKVLDVAEKIVHQQGVSALTVDAVAKAMGISKGGVQYCFGNKEALIDVMFDRWEKAYNEIFFQQLTQDSSAENRVTAHMKATYHFEQASNTKGAGLMAALLQTPEYLDSTREWHRERITKLDTSTEVGRRAQLVFFATEGAFILRAFGFMNIDQQEWNEIFTDIEMFLSAKI